MIPQETVQKIIDTSRIEEVIADFISLRKKGTNYTGLCPFHNEKTPSFMVSPAKGIFKCFGCGKGGNSVNFVMEHEHITYVESLKFLAKKYNIEVQETELTVDELKKKNNRESLLVITTHAQKYFSKTLQHTPEGKAIGLSYFKERKFRDDIIEKFQLGYSLNEKDAYTQEALKNGFKIDYLEQTGLTIVKDNYNTDRFRGRVIFPIHSLSGQVIGFGGRILKQDPEKKLAKYLNSPQSEIYDKSNTLYGIFYAKKSIVQQDKCYLVEGYTDVISMHQCGLENVVAASGTSLTEPQIRMIHRFTPNVTIIFDGDLPGIKAALRGINMVLEAGLNVKILLLPDGEDPDSFSKTHTSDEFIDYINKNEEDFIKFKTKLLLNEIGNDPIKKANLITDIVNTIAVIPNNITQAIYIKECSTMLDVSENVIVSAINKIKSNPNAKPEPYNYTKQVSTPTETPSNSNSQNDIETDNYCIAQEKEIIRLLLLYGHTTFKVELNEDIAFVKDYFKFELIDGKWFLLKEDFQTILTEYFEKQFETKDDAIKHFTNHINSKIGSFMASILSEKYTLSELWKRKEGHVITEDLILSELIPQTIFTYKKKRIDIEIHKLSETLKTITDIDESIEVMKKIKLFKNHQMIIAKDINCPL